MFYGHDQLFISADVFDDIWTLGIMDVQKVWNSTIIQ